MKKYILPVVFLLVSVQILSQTKKGQAEMIFKDTLHIFGTIWYDTEAVYEFTFKNTGKQPLIIEKVQSSCGCTVPKWRKKTCFTKAKRCDKCRI